RPHGRRQDATRVRAEPLDANRQRHCRHHEPCTGEGAAMSRRGWLFRRRGREEELDEEIQSHLRMAAEQRMERGETAEGAGVSAAREFGNVTLIKEVTREMWEGAFWETFWQDIRYGARMLRRNAAFTAVAVVSLALGIGANTAIFSLIDAVMLKMLPVQNPEQLVMLNWASRGWPAGIMQSLQGMEEVDKSGRWMST